MRVPRRCPPDAAYRSRSESPGGTEAQKKSSPLAASPVSTSAPVRQRELRFTYRFISPSPLESHDRSLAASFSYLLWLFQPGKKCGLLDCHFRSTFASL